MIPISKPWMDEREADAARRPILSGWVTTGPETAAFEAEFAEVVGAPHACAVSSATTGLHLALLAVGVKPGDEVITVSHSYIATANSVVYCNAIPVFVDIDPATYNLDPTLLAGAVSEKTSAILVAHQIGMPCDMDTVLAFARTHNLPVVEDAACAIGSEVCVDGAWGAIGAPHGDAAVFSFHPRKVISTGDGGMITSKSAEVDAFCRLRRSHGMSIPPVDRHAGPTMRYESHDVLGFNYRMTDIQAAVGRVQLQRMPDIVARRRALGERYAAGLADLGWTPPAEPDRSRTNWQSYCVRLPDELDQKEVLQRLLELGVGAKQAVMNAHSEPAYAETSWRAAPSGLGHSEAARNRCILLPLYPTLTEAEVDTVLGAVKKVAGGVGE